MLSFEETMALGQAQYQDVIDRLTAVGWPTAFTQTGGMNAALEIRLDGGFSLLVTDAADSLAWARDEHDGWTVGLYAPENQYDGDCMAYAVSDDSSVEALESLIRGLLRSAANQSGA
ncbi:hypothetical protein [Geodermatophilus marinus]|uniref:hypothetical protein n=1 Tax=Geodermatophilus sp. LHW52908 TaxID=2303986 RepID=UPI000E3D2887|nr:hypothetical protein [Geodermatophilus sp. LHW52908]RFU21035.1 hypothetical protein D0Z06_13215 [Geodermatophilus sp. LHW52908]